jgi:predicted nucleic acid-binding protein
MSQPAIAHQLTPLIAAGLVATCAPLDFEALYSSRTPAEYEDVWRDRNSAYEYLPSDDVDWRRALEVQRELAHQSQLRSVGMPDLLIAAVAERHKVTIIHHDADFESIAAITGQPTVRVEV